MTVARLRSTMVRKKGAVEAAKGAGGAGALSALLHRLGGGVAQFPDHPAEPCWTVLHCAPNLGRPVGRRLGMTQSNGLNQRLGGIEPKCCRQGTGRRASPL